MAGINYKNMTISRRLFVSYKEIGNWNIRCIDCNKEDIVFYRDIKDMSPCGCEQSKINIKNS